jgi:DNA polymerase/3'-5' exonuclease PolX
MNRLEATEVALQVCNLIAPACREIVLAGSLRRMKPQVKDIEIVVRPQFDYDLQGREMPVTTALDGALCRAIAQGKLAWDTQVKRNGPRYKRLIVPGPGIAVDLFLADAANFGNTLVIRTGDADFTRKVVTRCDQGGLMPPGLFQQDGYLWRVRPGQPAEKLACPCEAAFFDFLGLPVLPPCDRTLRAITTLRSRI